MVFEVVFEFTTTQNPQIIGRKETYTKEHSIKRPLAFIFICLRKYTNNHQPIEQQNPKNYPPTPRNSNARQQPHSCRNFKQMVEVQCNVVFGKEWNKVFFVLFFESPCVISLQPLHFFQCLDCLILVISDDHLDNLEL